MEKIGRDLKYLWSKKCFAVGVPLVTLLAYITQLLKPTVGIDDTSYKMYFLDGVAPAAGRWCLFLLRYLFPMDYNPYFMELLGIMLFAVSASLWCVVFYRIWGDRLSVWVYLLSAGALVSSPILSEVVVWYLQNGIFVGYGVTALAVLALLESLKTGEENGGGGRNGGKNGNSGSGGRNGGKNGNSGSGGRDSGKNGNSGTNRNNKVQIKALICSSVLLTVALGFYESFAIVFLMAVVITFALIREFDGGGYFRNCGAWIWRVAVILGASLILRTLLLTALFRIYHLEEQSLLRSRGLWEVLGWFDGSRDRDAFVFLLKEFFVKYYLHGFVYPPVFIFDVSLGIWLVWGIYGTMRKRDGWILAGVLAGILLPWLLAVLEGVATYYRSAQYVPLVTAVAVLMAGHWVEHCKKKTVRAAAFVLAGVLLYHQCYEMNQWLYVEALKYEDAKRTLSEVAWVVARDCDAGKPVCMMGTYEIPEGLLEKVYCPQWSKRYKITEKLVKAVGPEVFEKYDTQRGYAAAETPRLNFINWGMVAFHTYDRELVKFCKMHGFQLEEDLRSEHYREAEEVMREAPAWPAAGSVREMEDYIIVKFGD